MAKKPLLTCGTGEVGLGMRAPSAQARLLPLLPPVAAGCRGNAPEEPPASAVSRCAHARPRSRQPCSMAGALGGMFANQPPGPPPPGPPGGPGPAGLIPPPTGPRNPNNTLVDELEASFEVPRGRGSLRPGGGLLGAALSPPRFPPRRPASPRWSARTT